MSIKRIYNIVVNEVLGRVVHFLQLPSLLQSVRFGGSEKGEKDEGTLRTLEQCLNAVLYDLASNHFDFDSSVTIVTTGLGLFDLGQLGTHLKEVKGIYTQEDKRHKVDYVVASNQLVVKKKEKASYYMEYTYYPAYAYLDGTIYNCDCKVNMYMLAFGTAAEYCFVNGLYDMAKMWENRYKDAVLLSKTPHREIKLKSRRWL